jgi:hypothetical protein
LKVSKTKKKKKKKKMQAFQIGQEDTGKAVRDILRKLTVLFQDVAG